MGFQVYQFDILKGLCDVLKPYNAITQSCIMYICNTYMHKDGVVFRVKPVNKADTNVIN